MLWYFSFVCSLGENNDLFTDDRERKNTEQQEDVSNECSYVILGACNEGIRFCYTSDVTMNIIRTTYNG